MPADARVGPAALDGLRVVDLTQNLAGPFCTQTLGDLGADVIKIEPPGGDPARAWGPPFQDGTSTLFLSANRNKRSIALDLRNEAARAVVRRLAISADVYVQSLRPGAADALGLGPDALCRANPRLIACSVTAYGPRGPLADLPGYDPLMQAHAGLMSVTGRPGDPVRVGVSVVDMGTGLWAALAILAALRERDRTGRGTHIVTSLFETALSLSSYHLMGYWASGAVPGALGTSFPLIAPYGAFPTADGRLMIAAANDSLFGRLCDVLALDGTADDPRFRDNPGRVQHREALETVISTATRRRTTHELGEALRGRSIPCAPILDIAGVAAEPQTEAGGAVDRSPHPRVEGYASVSPPFEWAGGRTRTRRVPPLAGEHTGELLESLGFDPAGIERLRRAGALGNNELAGHVQRSGDRAVPGRPNGGSTLDQPATDE
jgi:formyl-CoA transferase/CoA:oxalate CoA-transferase